MKIVAVSKRSGPALVDIHRMIQDGHTLRLVRQVQAAIDRTGQFNRTGRLRSTIVVRRTRSGAELIAPPDRLRRPATRQAFIELLRDWMGAVQ